MTAPSSFPFGPPQQLVYRSADWALMRQLGAGQDVQPFRLKLALWLARHSGWLVAAVMAHAALVHGLGLCPNHLGHSARGGMPSTHATVLAFLAGWGSVMVWVC